ncbi:MAG: hypothetical protein ACLUKQ_12205 [Peptococcaceae bacterium]
MDLNITTFLIAIVNLFILAAVIGAAIFLVFYVQRKSGHRCPDCHKKVPADGQVCPYCGKQL